MIMFKNAPRIPVPNSKLLLYKKMESGSAYYITGKLYPDQDLWFCDDGQAYAFDYFDAWMWLPDNPSITDKI